MPTLAWASLNACMEPIIRAEAPVAGDAGSAHGGNRLGGDSGYPQPQYHWGTSRCYSRSRGFSELRLATIRPDCQNLLFHRLRMGNQIGHVHDGVRWTRASKGSRTRFDFL